MSWPYIQSSMQNVRVIDGGGIEYPFIDKGDTSTRLYRMVCEQLAEYYDPAQVALDTPMSSAAAAGVIALPFTPDLSAYFVGDTNHSHETGGMIRFERVFANIPQRTITPVGAVGFKFPGILAAQYSGTTLTDISSLSVIAGSSVLYINFSTPHGRALDETIYAALSMYVRPPGWVPPTPGSILASGGSTEPSEYLSFYNYAKIVSASTYQIGIDVGRVFQDQETVTLNYGKVIHSMPVSRFAFTAPSTVTENCSYVLPGVSQSITTYDDIPTPLPFSPINTTGQTVENLDETTIPTAVDYYELVKTREQLILDSQLTKWMGNIYKITTRNIRAL